MHVLPFVLAVERELLAMKLRNRAVTGSGVPAVVVTESVNIKLKQMADDTTLFLKNREEKNASLEIITLSDVSSS